MIIELCAPSITMTPSNLEPSPAELKAVYAQLQAAGYNSESALETLDVLLRQVCHPITDIATLLKGIKNETPKR